MPFFAFPDQLEGLHLSDRFRDISSYWRREDFIALDHPIRVENKTAAVLDPCFFIKDAEYFANLTPIILNRYTDASLFVRNSVQTEHIYDNRYNPLLFSMNNLFYDTVRQYRPG